VAPASRTTRISASSAVAREAAAIIGVADARTAQQGISASSAVAREAAAIIGVADARTAQQGISASSAVAREAAAIIAPALATYLERQIYLPTCRFPYSTIILLSAFQDQPDGCGVTAEPEHRCAQY
jgi:hypothetical protein